MKNEDYKKAKKIREFLDRVEYFPLKLGCNAGFPYGAGYLSREDDWIFRNGKMGGTFYASDDFVLEALWSNRIRIAKYFDIKPSDMWK